MSHTDPLLLFRLAEVIRQATQAVKAGDIPEENLPSATELAKHFGLRLENAKKKLRQLKADGLIQSVSVSPKRYRFDEYAFQHLPPEDPMVRYFAGEDTEPTWD